MNSLETFRYYKDDPKEFSFNLIPKKQDDILHKRYLSNLLTNSIKVSKDIFPSIAKSIEQVFDQLKIDNNWIVNKSFKNCIQLFLKKFGDSKANV